MMDTCLRPQGDCLPLIPDWIVSSRSQSLEDASMMSGAALSVLHGLHRFSDVPHALLRERLALRATEACVAFQGRPERAPELRDEVHLLRPGDHPGPSGSIFQSWRFAVGRRLTTQHLQKSVPENVQPRVSEWMQAPQGAPIAKATRVLETVIQDAPHHEVTALLLADATLARALRWDYLIPIFALGLSARDLHKTGDDLRLSCSRAVVTGITEAVQLAHSLFRDANRLRQIEPKLRAKGAGKAVELFLSRDALSPSLAFTGFMSDRAARRLCDRLVALRVVREMSGRSTFRLYGI